MPCEKRLSILGDDFFFFNRIWESEIKKKFRFSFCVFQSVHHFFLMQQREMHLEMVPFPIILRGDPFLARTCIAVTKEIVPGCSSPFSPSLYLYPNVICILPKPLYPAHKYHFWGPHFQFPKQIMHKSLYERWKGPRTIHFNTCVL